MLNKDYKDISSELSNREAIVNWFSSCLSTRKFARKKPLLSIIVIFHNMRREAARTLYSLSLPYQQDINVGDIEVIAIDNASSEPLDPTTIKSFGPDFRYVYFETESASPVEAINYGVSICRSDNVAISIDGARILSPAILKHTLVALSAFANPVIATLAFHLGPDIQNASICQGYTVQVEDELLANVDWKNNGYELFNISSLALSSGLGFLLPISESNFITMRRSLFDAIGGFETRFQCPGGGLANLGFYKRLVDFEDSQLVHILGEGTFHQIHGGVATNVPMAEHPKEKFAAEYCSIRNQSYSKPEQRPVFVGHMPTEALRFVARMET